MTMLDYFEALERLKNNAPLNVPINTRITNDSVALEAGRKRGSIKKSREVFSQLIDAIDNAAKEQERPTQPYKERAIKIKQEFNRMRLLYEEALNREIMLIKRVYELEAELAKLTKNRVSEGNFK